MKYFPLLALCSLILVAPACLFRRDCCRPVAVTETVCCPTATRYGNGQAVQYSTQVETPGMDLETETTVSYGNEEIIDDTELGLEPEMNRNINMNDDRNMMVQERRTTEERTMRPVAVDQLQADRNMAQTRDMK